MAGSFAVLSLIGFESVHALNAANAAKADGAKTPAHPPVTAAPMAKAGFFPSSAPVKALRKRLPSLPTMAGLASWYGSVLDGHKTASGEIFDKDKLTACHRSLPFGTLVRVVALATGKSVVVKINDRGVLSNERVIDLSAGAAKELGILRSGVGRVRLEILKGNEVASAAPAPAF